MPKSKTGVQFQHKRNGRRGSDASDAHSEPRSPVRAAMNGHSEKQEVIQEENPDEKKAEYAKKKQSFITRTLATFAMIAGFFWILFSGHLYLIGLITLIQILCFKEVIAIADVPSKARDLRFSRSLNWYFLGTTMYYLYGESVVYYFKHIILVDKVLLPFATHHRFISFMLYIVGFVFFVGSLQKGNYRFQFTQFAWTHMALCLIVVQAHFIMNNIFEGLIWMFLPAALVIINDIFAYICGITFGRTQLIAISPKKTVEGFLGAWICTNAGAVILTWLLTQSSYFTCPVNDLGANILTGLHCELNPVFIPHSYSLLSPFNHTEYSFTIQPIYFHALVFATFASLIAPFGGFFASGLKRTFKIKDFGTSIPGHGGMTDRMDCQFIMGFFAFMYYQSFIAQHKASVGDVIQTAIQGLSPEDQIELVRSMTRYLVNQDLVTQSALDCLNLEMVAKR